ncbi:MAG: LysM peptidoglycan-binding domain-containing protein [Longimicrobiales bacterium]
MAPAYAQQQTPPAPPAQTREHTVKRGDTLWDLARAYLSNPFLWPLIYDANRQVVEDPHRIYPAERLVIPPLPGEKPKVEPEAQPTQPVVITPDQTPRPPAGPSASIVPAGTRRTRFYSPPDTTTEPTLITAGALAARRVEPKEFHSSPWLADAGRLPVMGRVFKPAESRSEGSLLGTTFHPFDHMFLSYQGRTRPRAGDMLLIVSVGRGVGGFGDLIQPRGVVRVDSVFTSSMQALVTHQFGTLELGDLALPMDSFPTITGASTAVTDGPQGSIIEFLLPQPVYGTEEIAFVNLGSARGVKVGDEMVAQLPARSRDGRLPAQPVARLLVTRVTERSATVRVIELQSAVLKPGLPVRVVARMQ